MDSSEGQMSKIVERKQIIDVKSPEIVGKNSAIVEKTSEIVERTTKIVEKTSEIDERTTKIVEKTSEIDDQTDEMDNCDSKKIFSATFDLLAAESVAEMVIIKYL
jgi:hypothetical protein